MPRGWHSRGYLPHFDGGRFAPQFVTYGLADAIPPALFDLWHTEMHGRPPTDIHRHVHRQAEAQLDRSAGSCLLRNPAAAEIVVSNLMHFDGTRYTLHEWVVMPNHVHVLFTPAAGFPLADVVQSWKSFTSKAINKHFGRTGRLWREEYYDRFIRDDEHLRAVVEYIRQNPVKAGLCDRAEDWPHSSAAPDRGRPARSSSSSNDSDPTPSSPEPRAGGPPAVRRDLEVPR